MQIVVPKYPVLKDFCVGLDNVFREIHTYLDELRPGQIAAINKGAAGTLGKYVKTAKDIVYKVEIPPKQEGGVGYRFLMKKLSGSAKRIKFCMFEISDKDGREDAREIFGVSVDQRYFGLSYSDIEAKDHTLCLGSVDDKAETAELTTTRRFYSKTAQVERNEMAHVFRNMEKLWDVLDSFSKAAGIKKRISLPSVAIMLHGEQQPVRSGIVF